MVRDTRAWPRSERGRARKEDPRDEPRREWGLISAERSLGEGVPSEDAPAVPGVPVPYPDGDTNELPIDGVC